LIINRPYDVRVGSRLWIFDPQTDLMTLTNQLTLINIETAEKLHLEMFSSPPSFPGRARNTSFILNDSITSRNLYEWLQCAKRNDPAYSEEFGSIYYFIQFMSAALEQTSYSEFFFSEEEIQASNRDGSTINISRFPSHSVLHNYSTSMRSDEHIGNTRSTQSSDEFQTTPTLTPLGEIAYGKDTGGCWADVWINDQSAALGQCGKEPAKDSDLCEEHLTKLREISPAKNT